MPEQKHKYENQTLYNDMNEILKIHQITIMAHC